MNKLDLYPQSRPVPADVPFDVLASQPTAFSTDPETVRRLLVLIPPDSNHLTTARRIWELANALHARVQFFGLCPDAAEEPSMHRQLFTLSALVGDGRVSTAVKVEIGTDWVQMVKRNYQTGDMIVCFAEQRAGLLHRPLSQILQADLKMPVYILSGLYPQNSLPANRLPQIMAWIGSIGIIAFFFLLQVRLTSLSQDWIQTSLLILSVLGEAWLIGGWNSLFS